jgi:hypothetical protein
LTIHPFQKPGRRRVTARSFESKETHHLQFRCEGQMSRRINEIIALQIDPELRTRSDVLHDAVALWLDSFFLEHPNLEPQKNSWDLQKHNAFRILREVELSEMRLTLDRAKKETDKYIVTKLFTNAHKLRGKYVAEHASPTEMTNIDTFISDTKTALDNLK